MEGEIPASITDLVERPVTSLAAAAPGDVIETMKASKHLPRRVNRLRRCLRFSRVTNHCCRRLAERLLRSLRIVCVAPDQHDFRAGFDERLCRREPNSCGAAHDDENFVGQL